MIYQFGEISETLLGPGSDRVSPEYQLLLSVSGRCLDL